MIAADVKPGDVMYVRAKPGLPNGVRSRAGNVFTDHADTKVQVVKDPALVRLGYVNVSGAKLILEDNALVVRDQPALDSLADAQAEITRLTGELREADVLLERANAVNLKLNDDCHSRDDAIATLRRQVATLDQTVATLRADAAKAAASIPSTR